MSRISQLTKESAPTAIKPIFDMMQKKMGRVPNIFLNMGNSAETLQAYLSLSELTQKSSIPEQLREKIALVIAEVNGCNYCLSAHSAIAKSMGLQDLEILSARRGSAEDNKSYAILNFVKKVVEKKGAVTADEVKKLKEKGVSDKELCELMLIITLNIFTNYFNNIVDPAIDFPLAPKL